MNQLKQLWALFNARNKEYYRDRGSLIWSFILPPLIIAVVALAFSRDDGTLLKVGLLGDSQLPAALTATRYIDTRTFTEESTAVARIRHHQLDLLIDSQVEPRRYLYNPTSTKADVLRQLLNSEQAVETKPRPISEWRAEAIEGRQIRYIDWVIPGVLAMNLMFSGLYGVGYVIVRYRKNGVLKRLQASPVSPVVFLSAQLLSRLMIMLITSGLVFAVSHYFLSFMMLGSYLDLFVVAVVGNFSLLTMGLLVASRLANEELANGLLNLLSFPMLLLSELWFSLDDAPAWMLQLSQCLPLTHMVQAARAIMLEGATLTDVSYQLGVMAILSLVFLGIAAKIFSWRAP